MRRRRFLEEMAGDGLGTESRELQEAVKKGDVEKVKKLVGARLAELVYYGEGRRTEYKSCVAILRLVGVEVDPPAATEWGPGATEGPR